MSYETRDEIKYQNRIILKDFKNLRIENERLRIENEKLRKRGIFKWIKNMLNKGIFKNA